MHNGYSAHLGRIHRGFINSVPPKEDQTNLPPMVRPRCSLKVASERPINQCFFNVSDRNKKYMKKTEGALSFIDVFIRGHTTTFYFKCVFLCKHQLLFPVMPGCYLFNSRANDTAIKILKRKRNSYLIFKHSHYRHS